ncbi:MAG: hypothetical protein EXS08_08700 [Planctomycetes bacterium]|nr:hypothetical protein [Planctomycetota bacterium]
MDARSWLLALVALVAPAAAGDTLVLKDGRVFQEQRLVRGVGGVEVQFASGKVLVPDALVHLALIEGEAEAAPTTDEEREKSVKGLVLFEGEWIQKKRRDELIAKRAAARRAEVLDNLAHHEWKDRRVEETKNFRFEYTVSQHIFERYRERMEAYYQAFAKDWKIKPSSLGKLPVCFYSNEKEFHRTSGADSGTLAYFRFVEPYDLNAYFDPLDETLTEQVLYHEANHFLQKLIDEGFHYPHWPGEALAEYYGASLWDADKKKFAVGLVQEGRLAEIQDDIAAGDWMTLDKLLSGDQNEHYTWGWSLIYFLMNDPRHQDAFKRFFVGLAHGQDVRREHFQGSLMTVAYPDLKDAFKKYLGLSSDEKYKNLERDWHRYLEDKLLTNLSTRGKEKAAFEALGTERKLRAKRLFEEAIADGSSNPQVFHKYAQLVEKDDKKKAVELWRKATELAPLTGTYWSALGRALAGQDKAESERLRKLATEIDPELDEDELVWEF